MSIRIEGYEIFRGLTGIVAHQGEGTGIILTANQLESFIADLRQVAASTEKPEGNDEG